MYTIISIFFFVSNFGTEQIACYTELGLCGTSTRAPTIAAVSILNTVFPNPTIIPFSFPKATSSGVNPPSGPMHRRSHTLACSSRNGMVACSFPSAKSRRCPGARQEARCLWQMIVGTHRHHDCSTASRAISSILCNFFSGQSRKIDLCAGKKRISFTPISVSFWTMSSALSAACFSILWAASEAASSSWRSAIGWTSQWSV